jgi:ABC-2 type transport system ATP-binding protein
MTAQIHVRGLTKTFRVPVRESGFSAAIKGLFNRQYRAVHAVESVDFDVAAGEIVGFLGPNGAGKTTTLKMLSGLLHPSSGEASVLGHEPWKRRGDYLRRISMIMGQRSQLSWDIPAMDSFLVHGAVYGVSRGDFDATVAELTDLLDLEPLLRKPVRTLSLGERMKCEIAVSLLHRPAVMFLDEPTIGLDVTMQARIREFIQKYNRKHGATIILTSHYMADVTALCKRVVVIHNGKLLYDGPLDALADRMAPFKVITVDLEQEAPTFDFQAVGEVLERAHRKAVIRVARDRAPQVTASLLAGLSILDLTIEDPPIEDVIARVFHIESQAGESAD